MFPFFINHSIFFQLFKWVLHTSKYRNFNEEVYKDLEDIKPILMWNLVYLNNFYLNTLGSALDSNF